MVPMYNALLRVRCYKIMIEQLEKQFFMVGENSCVLNNPNGSPKLK